MVLNLAVGNVDIHGRDPLQSSAGVNISMLEGDIDGGVHGAHLNINHFWCIAFEEEGLRNISCVLSWT